MRVTENTLLRGDNGTWLDLISRRATHINKQDVQFTRLHLSLKHTHTHANRLRRGNIVSVKLWNSKRRSGCGFLPLSPCCSERVRDASRVGKDSRVLVLCGTTRLHRAWQEGSEARARVHVPARERYRGTREGGSARRRDDYMRIHVEAWTQTVCSQMRCSQGQPVKCPRFIDGGVSALG